MQLSMDLLLLLTLRLDGSFKVMADMNQNLNQLNQKWLFQTMDLKLLSRVVLWLNLLVLSNHYSRVLSMIKLLNKSIML